MDQIYFAALKLLKTSDHTVASLRQKLEEKFGVVPEEVFEQLLKRNFLNDRRFAENYVSRRKDRAQAALREDLIARGIDADIVDETLSKADLPSLREAMAAKMRIGNCVSRSNCATPLVFFGPCLVLDMMRTPFERK